MIQGGAQMTSPLALMQTARRVQGAPAAAAGVLPLRLRGQRRVAPAAVRRGVVPRDVNHRVRLGEDVKVILAPPCIFCMENPNEIYGVLSE